MARKRHRRIGRAHGCYLIDKIEQTYWTFKKDEPVHWSADIAVKRVRFRSRAERKAWIRGRVHAGVYSDGVPLYHRRPPHRRLRPARSYLAMAPETTFGTQPTSDLKILDIAKGDNP